MTTSQEPTDATKTSAPTNSTILPNSTVTINSDIIMAPPQNLTDGICGKTGLMNMGNTCYMNSAIQVFAHIYPLTHYIFNNREHIIQTLKRNAPRILKDAKMFKIGSATDAVIPVSLKQRIQDGTYDSNNLTSEEEAIILNCH